MSPNGLSALGVGTPLNPTDILARLTGFSVCKVHGHKAQKIPIQLTYLEQQIIFVSAFNMIISKFPLG